MATYIWEIYDVVDETIQPAQYSGEIRIDKLPIVEPDDRRWLVQMPDAKLEVPRQDGGTVRLAASSNVAHSQSDRSRLSNIITLLLYVLLVLLFGYGFVIVVTNDVEHRILDFKTYMSIIAAFLGGVGIGSFRKGKHSD